jgi:hypothetical protein
MDEKLVLGSFVILKTTPSVGEYQKNMDERKHKTPCPEKNNPCSSKLNGFIQLDPVKPGLYNKNDQ